jgi:hypothetical protein
MRALLSRESTLRSIPSTEPVLFLEARAPGESATFVACHADPPRIVTAGRAFTTIFPPTSDVPCRSQAPPTATMRRELVVRAALAIAPDLRRWCYHHRLDRKTACATFGSSGSVAFRRRIRREPACQSRTCALAVKRLRSLDPERLPPYRPVMSLHPRPTPPLPS